MNPAGSVKCPICESQVGADAIEAHVNQCLDSPSVRMPVRCKGTSIMRESVCGWTNRCASICFRGDALPLSKPFYLFLSALSHSVHVHLHIVLSPKQSSFGAIQSHTRLQNPAVPNAAPVKPPARLVEAVLVDVDTPAPASSQSGTSSQFTCSRPVIAV